jgi:DNA-binding CsgD family transcriptional regulator
MTNAVGTLATNIKKNQGEAERQIALAVRSKVMPVIESLCANKQFQSCAELDMLLAYLHDITSGLSEGMKASFLLSPTELRIAAMIKNGLSNSEIASQLFISESTVKTHRKNIRRKLNLRDSKINLRSYLQAEMNYW